MDLSAPTLLDPTISLALTQARVKALESLLADAAEQIATREVRLAELNRRVQTLEDLAVRAFGQGSAALAPVAIEAQWVRQADLAAHTAGSILQLSGAVLGIAPAATTIGVPSTISFVQSLPALEVFCRLMGLAAKDHVRAMSSDAPLAWEAPSVGSWPVLSLGDGISFHDLWFANSHTLRLRLESRESVVVRAWQYDLAGNGGLGLTAEALLSARTVGVVDVSLLSPLLPVLLSVSQPDGQLRCTAVLPFPSLCRGGLHYGETCASDPQASGFDALRRLSKRLLDQLFTGAPNRVARVAVDLDTAIGIEPMFALDTRLWLQCVFGTSLEAVIHNSAADVKRHQYLKEALVNTALPPGFGRSARTGSAVLAIPADGMPSIQAMSAHVAADDPDRQPHGAGSFIACDSTSQEPRWSITVPASAARWLQTQPSLVPGWPTIRDGTVHANIPLALRFSRPSPGDSRHVLPPGPRISSQLRELARHVSGRISVLLAGDAPAFIESLKYQDVVTDVEVVVESGSGSRHARLNRAALRASGQYLMVAHESLLLHDPHTLTILRLLSSQEGVATAGCVVLAEFISKGKATVAFQGGPLLALARPFESNELTACSLDVRSILPFATLPVIANEHLFVTRTDIWTQLGGLHDGDDIDFDYARRAAALGLCHLNTAIVSASFEGDASASPQARPQLGSFVSNAACLLTELRP